MTELIRALRCSNSTEHIDCAKEKCKYFYREPQETIDKFREEHGGKFREFPDDIFETCDYEQIALDAADELEKLCDGREEYRWHDLRKDPTDLPQSSVKDYVVAEEWDDGEFTYTIGNRGYIWAQSNDNDMSFKVIAWRETEPFESEVLK